MLSPLTLYALLQQTNFLNHAAGPQTTSPIINLNSMDATDVANHADGTMGPVTWQGNFSNTLPLAMRGKLEARVIDPPQGVQPPGLSKKSTGHEEKPSESVTPGKHKPHGPGEINGLSITISKVEVHLAYLGTPGKDINDGIPTAEPEDPMNTPVLPSGKGNGKAVDHWETLDLTYPVTVDLVQLADSGDFSSLGLTSLAAGHYTQVRLYISDANAILPNESMVPLKLVGKNHIVKIVRSFNILPGGTTVLTFDFDAQHSVVKTGNDYLLKPVIGKLLVSEGEGN